MTPVPASHAQEQTDHVMLRGEPEEEEEEVKEGEEEVSSGSKLQEEEGDSIFIRARQEEAQCDRVCLESHLAFLLNMA